MRPLFITFEGGEGAGKSTQVERLAQRLRSPEHDVVTTREPGGTKDAEDIRNLLVAGEAERWSAEAEALLNYAARDHHLRHLIRPALERGASVICDRFMDSTRVYQGFAGGCDLGLIDRLEQAIVGHTRPAMTFVFDLNPEIGLARAKLRGGADRYEKKGLEYHVKLRDGFQRVALANPARCHVIDASKSEDDVAAQIWAVMEAKLDGR
jgi:dTMP kinase